MSNMNKMNNRFMCLKPEKDESVNHENRETGRLNRFKTPVKNSRWERSKSPEKGNSFTAKGRDYNRRNFNNRRNNNRNRKVSKKFNGIEKDSKGRPMIHNATTKSFNLDFALRKKSSKSPDRKRKKKKNKTNINSHENIKPKFITSEKTQEEIEKEKEWNRKMILNMQYETDSEQEEEFPDDEM